MTENDENNGRQILTSKSLELNIQRRAINNVLLDVRIEDVVCEKT